MDPIPFNVTTEILSRLPAKTLVRFRLACKRWESVICDQKLKNSSVSRFLFTVCNREERSLSFLVSPPATELVGAASFSVEAQGKLALPDDFCFTRFGDGFDPRPIQYPLIESVHGLVIIENEHGVVVHNPSTRESKLLPDAVVPVEKGGLWENQMLFGATVLHYDPISDDYMCLRFEEHPISDQHPISGDFDGIIIRLEDSEWKKLPRPHKGFSWSDFNPTSAYLDGTLYLANQHGELVKFLPSSGTYEQVTPPKFYLESEMYVLFIYLGKLALTSRLMRKPYDWCLFTLEDVSGECWTRVKFLMNDETRRTLKQCEKRGITDAGEIILVNQDLRMQNDIYYYDPSSGVLRVCRAEVRGLNFKTQFGEIRPRALLHTDHVETLTFLK